MGIVHHFGKPDIFVTFMCNPTWPEITNSLLGRQSANDRPNLCSHVVVHINVIEFQNRSLSYVHILFIVAIADKLVIVDDYDAIISAEYLDSDFEPEALAIISCDMVHRSYRQEACLANSSPSCCIKNGNCQKHYPKSI
ncbi:hypothetical protein PHYBLDRAFT_23515 [Phycomyces blakesleeanus NRRL 1555(-)]|uniref:Helitron helicase-like domain-containing protein n=1 Tax=Phycomyces blakesleeanus (strain ATCC 8743b / DSM 1359 / FGSC 10004 / NBRC 33097 / NRRL 1555) TaxID=763407 RepID=A0A162Y3D5_PHYB8|nr:hypothetical protein PHYBLDRAFT_23515 [Phycomyces blakesleeanus NRRL 1555(-)]OAD78085.1 hypothetical protein PHYBLDRAFT_23515 [Phycomyces blakesleeanus NRRL 1555(-)]|eukprot:XP_018296125.1 hypothetical protein PHYBLDRAFT_23515 [Phycomyces blakesleeanus NRRL 1555(-)]